MKLILNIVLFYIGWFASIFGAADHDGVCGPWIVLLCFLIHLLLHKKTWTREIKIGVAVMVFGSLLDSILPLNHIVTFATVEPTVLPSYPLWMMMQWLGFATTFQVSLSWLKKRTVTSFIFGFIGGPVTFIAAERLGAVTISTSHGVITSLLLIGIVWGIIIPLVLRIPEVFEEH